MAREMKNSGIKWIGDIPNTWKLEKIKYSLKERIEKNVPIKSKQILSLTAKQGVVLYENKIGAGNKPKEDFTAYKIARPNDIVMNSMNILSGSVGLSSYFGCVSPVYYMLYSEGEYDIRYFYYIFKTNVFQKSLFGLGNGILIKESEKGTFNTIRMRIPMDKFGNLFIPIASVKEQQNIANYLDNKCSEIDNLTADIEKQISLLEDYKKSIITEAVTKGLDPNVEMKDSGVEWIGKISKNFKLSKVKYELECPMKYGATESGVEFSEELPRYIRITDISANNKLKEENKLSLTWQQAKPYMLVKNSVLFARSGATVGKTFLYKTDYGNMAFAGYLISAIPNETKMYAKWLYYFSISNSYKEWSNLIFTQATIQNISAEKYSNLFIPIPNLGEQNRIINFLDKKCSEIDSLISDKKEQLEKLASYKQSMIYEYVTGKKEVPAQEIA